MKQYRSFAAGTLCCILALLSIDSCSRKKPHTVSGREWEPYVSEYTGGLISREATIRVKLRNATVSDSLAGKPVEPSPFQFSPAIKGTAVWVDTRTIEFRPGSRLEGGTSYSATFQIARFLDMPANLRVFKFDFAVVKQRLDVSLNALEPLKNDDLRWQRLTGSIRTADVDDAVKIEKVLGARQGNRTLGVRWEHGAGRQGHSFIIDSIERGEQGSAVQVSWNGAAIGVDKKEQKTVQVPAIGEFSILECRAITSGEQGLSIRFSDPLRADQDIVGLVTIDEDASPRFSIGSNEIRVYFSKRIAGTVHCTVNPGIRNIADKKFHETIRLETLIESLKPAVRFTGKGVILPDAANLTVPFEAVNLSAVDVRVVRIYEGNIPQFLQVNDLGGEDELMRVGRTVFKQTVALNTTTDMGNRWVRAGFDVSSLIKQEPGALYRIVLSFKRSYSLYPCAAGDTANFAKKNSPSKLEDSEDEEVERSYWDYAQEYEMDWDEIQSNKDNPCHPAYYCDYWDHKITVARNFIASNIGLSAKRGASDTILLAATDLTTAQPNASLDVTICNYQNQIIGRGKTDGDGFASVAIDGPGKPWLCIAGNDRRKGYLRLDNGSSLPISQFDVGGAAVPKGLKGILYGERGVWRPGDSLYLTFVLEDKTGKFPATHPVMFELVNPQGQVVQSLTRANPVDRFYDLRTATAPDAPTGDYTARVIAGGTVFERKIKIEMVMPNRLKVRLDFGADTLVGGDITGTLSSRWLTGALARNLKADVEMTIKKGETSFPRYKDYTFDDPARGFETSTNTVFDGELNGEGVASVKTSVSAGNAPGMLAASFRTRVFEQGGAFSVDKFTIPYSPYRRYVGLLPPRGDRARGMLLTDTTQTVHVVTVTPGGVPETARRVEVTLYKVNWRWWWEQGEESFSDYLTSEHHEVVKRDTIATPGGAGTWNFRVAYPQWGRYLIRAVDLDGGHAAGRTVYIDWPSWAGNSQKEIPGGATVLAFSSDKQEYAPGEKAHLVIPGAEGGRILVSLENGSRVLRRFWVNSTAKETAVSIDITPDMAPTVYIGALYLQKYEQTVNDLPMRMYGVIPISVVDPATRLTPVIETPAVLEPESRVTISVREKSGHDMTYTLALVDEGLLDLTRFETTNLWSHFYRREALGVMWWDVYDQVCGAYGAQLERLLSIGGDDGLANPGQKRGNRFPPMVRFMGPFHLKRGDVDRHTIDIPQYVGSVRIMVVGGYDNAYGSADTAVPVRKPLMLLGTLPRTLGPRESLKLPVSVFALEPSVKNVTVNVSSSGPVTVNGSASRQVSFPSIGDELVEFDLATADYSGWAKVTMTARAGSQRAEQTIDIFVRNPSRPVVDVTEKVLQSGESWKTDIVLPGIAGTNSLTLEFSRIPPIDLTRRLDYLLGYPHGCAEQTTSQVFPQLFIARVAQLSDNQKNDIQKAVQAAIARIPLFQTSGGGFGFWPGGGDPDWWVSCYVGHFLLEAKQAGYTVPDHVMRAWVNFQKSAANNWSGSHRDAQLMQAYRLYTLSLAQSPELGAMNRLREAGSLDNAAKWRLAAAYALAGQADAARQLAQSSSTTVEPYSFYGATYGSDLRDRAMILEALVLMKENDKAAPLAQEIAKQLTTNEWLSTQSTAYALLAMAKFAGSSEISGKIDATYSVEGGKETGVLTSLPLMRQEAVVDPSLTKINVTCRNRSQSVAWIRCIARGTPEPGTEKPASEGLSLDVRYLTKNGRVITPDKITQGTDFIADVTVSAEAGHGDAEQIALSQLFASGWEIRNTRMEGDSGTAGNDPYTYRDFRDDRVYTYFTLPENGSRHYRVLLHAAYIGSYALPPVYAESMYDGTMNAREAGVRVQVVEPGK